MVLASPLQTKCWLCIAQFSRNLRSRSYSSMQLIGCQRPKGAQMDKIPTVRDTSAPRGTHRLPGRRQYRNYTRRNIGFALAIGARGMTSAGRSSDDYATWVYPSWYLRRPRSSGALLGHLGALAGRSGGGGVPVSICRRPTCADLGSSKVAIFARVVRRRRSPLDENIIACCPITRTLLQLVHQRRQPQCPGGAAAYVSNSGALGHAPPAHSIITPDLRERATLDAAARVTPLSLQS